MTYGTEWVSISLKQLLRLLLTVVRFGGRDLETNRMARHARPPRTVLQECALLVGQEVALTEEDGW